MIKLTLLNSSMDTLLHGIFHDILLHGVLDTLKIVPFLFVTYLLMELLEHKASDKVFSLLSRCGKAGPFIGGALGAIPQCGFSTVGSNFFSGKIITLGTLIAIFLSTSDEMLPILISGSLSPLQIFTILIYKTLCGILVGFLIDLIIRLTKKDKTETKIHELCEESGCNCEGGILKSALHHTLTVGAFLLVITLTINALVFFVGSESLASILYDKPFISHLISAFIGLVPNCAVSVALTNFYIEGFITAGTMLSGLFAGAGVGLLVLFRMNKNLKENLFIMGILVLSGVIFGMLFDVIPFNFI